MVIPRSAFCSSQDFPDLNALHAAARRFADKTAELARNDAALDGLRDTVAQQVKKEVGLQLLRPPEYRIRDGQKSDSGIDCALTLQRAALEVSASMAGGTSAQILAAIGRKMLDSYPTPVNAHFLLECAHDGASTAREKQILWAGVRLSQGANGKARLAVARATFDQILQGAPATVPTVKTIVTHSIKRAGQADTKGILGEAIQVVSNGHLRSQPAANIFEAQALPVSRRQQAAATAVDVGPHFQDYRLQWDRDVTIAWLKSALASIPDH